MMTLGTNMGILNATSARNNVSCRFYPKRPRRTCKEAAAAQSCTVRSARGCKASPIACGSRSTNVLFKNSGLMDNGAVSVRAVHSGRRPTSSVAAV